MINLEFAKNLALNAALTCLEAPPPRIIRVANPGNISAITRSLRNAAHDELCRFPAKKSRSAILEASRSYLTDLNDREELLVGLGKRRGQGAIFDGFWLGRGDRTRVAFTPLAIQVIENQLRVANAEIVVIHNHPWNYLKATIELMLGWRPLPSSRDRDIALESNWHIRRRFLDSPNAPRFRWYLVDQGRIAEFHLPSIERITTVIARYMEAR